MGQKKQQQAVVPFYVVNKLAVYSFLIVAVPLSLFYLSAEGYLDGAIWLSPRTRYCCSVESASAVVD